jgi:L-lactate dehydrogenase complex protein LldG
MLTDQPDNDARAAILYSIRARLAESAPHDAVMQGAEATAEKESVGASSAIGSTGVSENGHSAEPDISLAELFRERLEAVGGHCLVVGNQGQAATAFNQIIANLQATSSPAKRIALSDAPMLAGLAGAIEVEIDELTISPNASDLFSYDVGVTTAQAAIAETGTLVLESERERHRLISLLPPVHIALINSTDICLTLREALKKLRAGWPVKMSRAITFITGPSRTADIELTLTIGVHGPKEVYVIIMDSQPLLNESE